MANQFIIPTLNTQRLILRPFEKGDLDPFADMVADIEVIRHATYDGTVMTRTQAWNWLFTTSTKDQVGVFWFE